MLGNGRGCLPLIGDELEGLWHFGSVSCEKNGLFSSHNHGPMGLLWGKNFMVAIWILWLAATTAAAELPLPFVTGEFRWEVSDPVVSARPEEGEQIFFSVKDPTAVWFGERWHLFCTVRGRPRTHQIEYIRLHQWGQPLETRPLLAIIDGYYCAPQVFYYRPHRKWYLIYQTSDPSRKPTLQPAFSTNERLHEPGGWSPPEFLYPSGPPNVQRWIDFWVICDDRRAHLFFTSLDGRLWRAETSRQDFPRNWSEPRVVLEADIFEAAHIYRLRGYEKYLAIVEAQRGPRRYYKAYLADILDGTWQPLADRWEKPFLGLENVRFRDKPWCESFSHGELLRVGFDEYLEVDPHNLVMLFQGVSDRQMGGKAYGEIPWKLGLATLVLPKP
jgi:hypothetical protein